MGERKKQDAIVPDFDVVLWGYDRAQVQQCLDDMTLRLEDALSKLDSVEVLQEQLSEARLELDQMRLAAEENPSWSDRLSKIMMTAEALRERAEREAAASHAGNGASADLASADLASADLASADLASADLASADLATAD